MMSITQRIFDFNKNRLQEILPYKYEAMSSNMFSFYRATCHIFYEDLSQSGFSIKSPLGWTCGDLHLENFGSYKGNNRLVYFDLNDFDEALLAPVWYELVRVITSIYVAFDSLKIERNRATHIAGIFLKEYCRTLAHGKACYIEPKTAKGIVCEFLTLAGSHTRKDLMRKKTEQKKGKVAISGTHPKHLELEPQLKKELCDHIKAWIKFSDESPYHFKVTDAKFRLAGTSSLGLKRYVFLLKNTRTASSHILLEMKQAAPSQAQQFISGPQPLWPSEGERVVSVQHRMQNVSPALASTSIFKGDAYIIQEMQPVKDSINFKLLKKRYRDMCQVISDMAILTASAQLRSAGREGADIPDKLIAFGLQTDWQEKIIEYAEKYVEQVRNDHSAFKKEYRIFKKSKRKEKPVVSL